MADTLATATKSDAAKKASNTRAKGQLAEAGAKLANQGKRFHRMRANAGAAGLELVRTLETQGTALVGGAMEGYWGESKMKLGGKVRWRGLAGLGLKGWGVMAKLGGKSGDHQAAFGDGLLACDMVSIGMDVGRTYAEKKNSPASAPGADAAPPPAVQGALREIADDGLDMSGNPDVGRRFIRGRRESKMIQSGQLTRVSVI